MHLNSYPFTCSEDRLEYYFESVGPRGVIRKKVVFSPYRSSKKMFNLALGDINEVTRVFDDFSVSNNNDRGLILATVGMIVLDFLSCFPDRSVRATGNTPERTRLYQMGLCVNLKHLDVFLTIQGYRNGAWESFQSNVRYEAFIAKEKTSVNL